MALGTLSWPGWRGCRGLVRLEGSYGNKDARRSDRVPVELPIVVTGTDAMGAGFLEQTRTVMVGRHGAKILLIRMLVPDQEVNVRCLKTSRESDARIVGQLGSEGGGHFYGIELLDDDPNLWGIRVSIGGGK